MSEIFSIGDEVTYADRLRQKFQQCKIVKVMPLEHAQSVRHYRIRDPSEPFERAVPGFALTRTAPYASELLFKT